jgi:opacity protein-like surface antigen
MVMVKQSFAVVLGMLVLAMSSAAFAQNQPDPNANNGNNNANGNNGNNRGNRGNFGRGNFDPAQMRQRIMDNLKQDMDVKDDEWAVIQPKLDKVLTISFDSRMRGGNMFRRNRGQDQQGNNNRPQPQAGDSAVTKAQADLQSALDDKSINADEIAKRLANLRAAKDAAKQDMVKAQQDLKELLSQRQEAVLVLAGLLD